MKKKDLTEKALTRIDVLRALATGIQNVPIDLNCGDIIYPVKTSQAGNTLTIECTDGSVINLSVEVQNN
jgi:hypothetical protein